MVKRMELQNYNACNHEMRVRLTYEAWTDVAAALIACTKTTAPQISRQIFDACDLRNKQTNKQTNKRGREPTEKSREPTQTLKRPQASLSNMMNL